MNCMTFGVVGIRGDWLFVGAPRTHSMSGLSLARHVHWSSHCGTVLSCGLEFWFPTFMSV